MFLLVLEWEEQRGEERERNMEVRGKHWLAASHMRPDQGLNLQTRFVPWPEFEPMTCWCMGHPPDIWPGLFSYNWKTLPHSSLFLKEVE